MTEAVTNTPARTRKRRGPNKVEYAAYFSLIFMTAVPTAFAVWALAQIGIMENPGEGPIKSAWSQASIITPKIFWA